MFGFGKAKKEARQFGEAAARMAITPFWDFRTKDFDARIWSDPYVLGVIQGSIAAQMLPITGRKLNATEKGFVIMDAMSALGASEAAIKLSLSLAQSKDPEYARGHTHGVVTFLLMSGTLSDEARKAPDIVAAQEAVPSMRAMDAILDTSPRNPDDELASAYIYMNVVEHKAAHYSD